MNTNSDQKGEWFISGPSATITLRNRSHVEPVIKALCEITGDLSEDYTATDLSEWTSLNQSIQEEQKEMLDSDEMFP